MKPAPEIIWRRILGGKSILLVFFALTIGRLQAETAIWSDNFETNAGSRWTTNINWLVTAPASGPATNQGGYHTYSGTRCATTGLNANNADNWFICTNYNGNNFLTIPSTNVLSRLRFWQWYDFVNAGGCVKIRTSGSTNWQNLTVTNLSFTSTASSSSGVWSRPAINLSAFAGTNVQFAFYFFSGANTYGTDLGWYVDDIAVVTNQPVFNNPETFENGLGDWSVDGGTWIVGAPTSGTNQAHTGTNCAGTVLTGSYAPNINATRLISPPFTVPTSGRATLHYWQWYQMINAVGFVQITTDGNTWQSISTTNLSSGKNAISSGGWKTNFIDISSYAGKNVEIAFNFGSGQNYGSAPGWYIDDVSISATPVLIVPTNVIPVYPTTTLTVNLQALITPGGPATFALLAGSPTNATLNSASGVFTWTPDIAQIGTNTVTVSVTDTNGLSATNSFYVQVLPLIVLTVPTSQMVYAGQTLTLLAGSATNSYATNATFAYNLAFAPTNVSLNSTSGILTWAPNSSQAGSQAVGLIATQTSNTNPPVPSVGGAFTIQVLLPPAPVLNVMGGSPLTNGFQFGFATGSGTTNINGVSWLINVSTNLLNWTLLTNATVSNNVLNISDPAATNYSRRFYRAVLP